jgi:uncharacterized membrane protein
MSNTGTAESISNTRKSEEDTDICTRLFIIGMWWRISYGVLRIAIGLVLIHHINSPISDVFFTLMRHEVAQDPADFFITTVGGFLAHSPLTITFFAIFYLVFWGTLDIICSIGLLQRKLWAFKVSIYLIWAFVAYELFRYLHTHSSLLLCLVVADLTVLYLIQREYNYHMKNNKTLQT